MNKHIGFLCLTILLLFIPPAGNSSPPGADDKKIQVLKTLSDQGSIEAMHRLANLYIRSPDKKRQREGFHLYLRAAARGYKPALFALGTQLASQGNDEVRQIEGLILIAMAELQGQVDAHLSLMHLPDLAGVDPEQIRQARLESVRRIRSNRLLGPAIMKEYEINLSSDEKRFVRTRTEKIRRKLNISRNTPAEAVIQKTLETYKHQLANRPVIDPEKLASIEQKYRLKNEINQRAMQAMKEKPEATRNKDYQMNKKRMALRAQGAQTRITTLSEQEKQALNEKLVKMLTLVNQHRSRQSAVSLDQLPITSE